MLEQLLLLVLIRTTPIVIVEALFPTCFVSSGLVSCVEMNLISIYGCYHMGKSCVASVCRYLFVVVHITKSRHNLLAYGLLVLSSKLAGGKAF